MENEREAALEFSPRDGGLLRRIAEGNQLDAQRLTEWTSSASDDSAEATIWNGGDRNWNGAQALAGKQEAKRSSLYEPVIRWAYYDALENVCHRPAHRRLRLIQLDPQS